MSRLSTLAVTLLFLQTGAVSLAENWNAWRGPSGQGLSQQTGIPLDWSQEKNIRWKVKLAGPGNSTPIIWEDRIFLSGAEDEGKVRTLLCFDRKEGKQLWRQAVEFAGKQPTHKTNPYCSSSPITDGRRVFVWHGSAGLFAYDLNGKELWKKDLGKFEHIWGTASSPVLHEKLLILSAGPGMNTFVAAFDQSTGEEVWRVEPAESTSEKVEEFRGSWGTPMLYEENGKSRMLISLPNYVASFDPNTGKEIWKCRGLSKLAYTSVVVRDGIAVAMSGYYGPALAVRTGGKGDVTETHRLWLHDKKNPQRIGSGVIVDGHLYILNEPGIAWCLDVKTGEKLWEKRLGSTGQLGGKCWSSMSLVDGRLYVINMKGVTFVLEVNPKECNVLAENPLGELTRGSLAFSDGQIVARTYQHLVCIEKGQ